MSLLSIVKHKGYFYNASFVVFNHYPCVELVKNDSIKPFG